MYPYFFHTRRDVRGHEEQGSLEEHVPSRSIQVRLAQSRFDTPRHTLHHAHCDHQGFLKGT